MHRLRELFQPRTKRAIVDTVSDTDHDTTDEPRIRLRFNNWFETKGSSNSFFNTRQCRLVERFGTDDLNSLLAVSFLKLKPGRCQNFFQQTKSIVLCEHSQVICKELAAARRNYPINEPEFLIAVG